ncbi:MAG: helix-turn-helix domain-containing protein [Patescibacteria group bacterium]
MIPSLKKALESIGLNKNEMAVLLVLLESSPMLVSAVAKAAKLNRSTTYGVLKLLADKGLASSGNKKGVVRYQSIAPEQLPSYIERRRDALADTKQQVEALLPQLKLLRAKGKTLPKVHFFEGVEGVKQAYEDTLENNQGKVLKDISGVDAAFERLGEEWATYYLKKRTRLGIKCVDLAPESEWAHKNKENDKKYLRTTKLLPAKYGFDAELALYDNKIGIFSYAQENPIALIIEDDTVSDMMQKLFDCLETVAR